jgi:hypothetical protein
MLSTFGIYILGRHDGEWKGGCILLLVGAGELVSWIFLHVGAWELGGCSHLSVGVGEIRGLEP